jgi:nitrate reductase NapE component
MVAVSALGLLLTTLAMTADGRPAPVVLAAVLMVGIVSLLAAVALGGCFPEPAYVLGSRSGPLLGALTGLVLGLASLAVLRRVAAPRPRVDPAETLDWLFTTIAVLPAAGSVALVGWYGAGVLATRHAILKQRRAANPPPMPGRLAN